MVLSFFFYNFANEKEKSCLTSKLMYNMVWKFELLLNHYLH